jgi:hypothetical protein
MLDARDRFKKLKIPNLDLFLSSLFLQSSHVITAYLQNSPVSELSTYQLYILRVIP